MGDYLPENCTGCDEPITPAVGVYYCPRCIAEQECAERLERIAFDEYHAFVDQIAYLDSEYLEPRRGRFF